jgi:hypothetical protein
MSFTATVWPVVSRVVRTIRHHPGDQIGRSAANGGPAGHHDYRETDASVNSASQNESSQCGNRHGGEGLIPDVLAQIAPPHRTIS